jgi:glycosyltransferase involved in cell wall biosynthesis
MKASVYTIVVTYNGRKDIERCLESLANSAIQTHVLIVDNASEDGTLDVVRGMKLANVEILPLKRNLGFGRANNIGVNYAYENGRRRHARLGSQLQGEEWKKVLKLLRKDYSPEQVAGFLRRTGDLSISHETIYRYVWQDKAEGGNLHTHLRGARKQRRKRYGANDSRGRLAGKRMIGERGEAWRY